MAPEIFAVDYIGVVTGRVFGGDGTQNGDWFGYGAPIRAVAGGRVVPDELTVTGKPHNAPREHPLITSVSDYSR
jgi:hypothetical protein